MMTKVTFKNHSKLTELGSAGYSQWTDMKIKKKSFGTIDAPNWRVKDDKYSISIMVEKTEPDNNPNCSWRWIAFGERFNDPESAKLWIQEHIEIIQQKYTLRFSED